MSWTFMVYSWITRFDRNHDWKYINIATMHKNWSHCLSFKKNQYCKFICIINELNIRIFFSLQTHELCVFKIENFGCCLKYKCKSETRCCRKKWNFEIPSHKAHAYTYTYRTPSLLCIVAYWIAHNIESFTELSKQTSKQARKKPYQLYVVMIERYFFEITRC